MANYDNRGNKRPQSSDNYRRTGSGGRERDSVRNGERRPDGRAYYDERRQMSGSANRRPAARSGADAGRRAAIARRKRRNKTIKIFVIILAIILAAIIVILIATAGKGKNNNENQTTQGQNETTAEETTADTARYEVNLISVGDVLMHTPLLNYANDGNGNYDFNSIFAVLKDDISAADIAVCNQETPIDTTKDPDGGISFIFNTPGAIGDAEINAGFDVILQSSNHSYDMGADGILNTCAFWQTKEGQAVMIGMNDSQEKRDTITIYEKNGIKFALLNYTYGLNGFALPDDMQYLTTIMDDNNKDLIISDVQKAKEQADFVIVFPHWGTEDLTIETTEFQDEWAKIFTEAGADLIIGTHPHVCEKIEWIEAGGNKALCYYSIGNFASNQQELPEVLGGMARVKIVKENGKTYIDESGTGVTPVVTQNINMGNFTNQVVVYKLSDYTEDMANQHDIKNSYDASFSAAGLNELAEATFGSWIIK